jgi:long-chain acyl-CoA synthetase
MKTMNSPKNVLQAFWSQCEKRPLEPALVRKKNGKWEPLTWRETGIKVAQLASAFQKLGLQRGDRVAIFADNCPEWVITDLACMAAGLVSVPLYPSLTQAQVQYIIEHSESQVAIVRGLDRLKKLLPLGRLKKIVVVDVTPQGDRTVAFNKFIEKEHPTLNSHHAEAFDLSEDDLATIVYTSGTTAEPKGVMLTHGNIMAQCRMLSTRAVRRPDDIVLSYLPLSHITERANIFRQALVGYQIYFAQNFESVAQDLKEVRPNTFVAVPRVWEKFQEGILAKVQAGSAFQNKLFQLALEAGEDQVIRMMQGRSSPTSLWKTKFFQFFVGRKVRVSLGLDRCRLFVSGAAPLDLHTLVFYYSMGMPMVEAYGMTECAGGCHYNYADRPAFGTVGPALDGVETQIAEDGEILLRGQNIFVGYYKDPSQTKEALQNGWLHTGDIGVLDSQGNLTITDRKKNIIITSGGKNVAPAPLETKIKRHPYVSQAVVIGDRRKFLTALITLAPGVGRVDGGIAVAKHLESVNEDLPTFEKIKQYTILDKEFTAENGELTPTLKVRRAFIQERYKNVIDEMYTEADKNRVVSFELSQNARAAK